MARYNARLQALSPRRDETIPQGERCYTEKCSYTPGPTPGSARQARVKLSEYAIRLREKQKVRRIYGVLERHSRSITSTRPAERANRRAMLGLLESRLDNVVQRLGFAFTRARRASSSAMAMCSSTGSATTFRA